MGRNRALLKWTMWAVIGCAVVSACAARDIRIEQDRLVSLREVAPLKLARHEPPTFAVADAGNSLVGSLSGVSGGRLTMPGRGAGDAPLEEEYALDDPGVAVRDKVFEALEFELGVRRESDDGPVLADDRVETATNAMGHDGWALDVKTLRWGLAYDETLWTRYRVQVQARGRLIDLSRGRVRWQATCDGSETRAPRGSVLAELTAHDAEALKERLAAAADRCASELVAHLFAGVR